jgi:hypothetical protein
VTSESKWRTLQDLEVRLAHGVGIIDINLGLTTTESRAERIRLAIINWGRVHMFCGLAPDGTNESYSQRWSRIYERPWPDTTEEEQR